METVICNVGEIDIHDREAFEHVLGQSLHENQQLVIRIVNRPEVLDTPPRLPAETNEPPRLPEWCNVYEGLSDVEIADLERTIVQRADLSRPYE